MTKTVFVVDIEVSSEVGLPFGDGLNGAIEQILDLSVDLDLLGLKKFHGIPILTVAQTLRHLDA